MPTKTKTKNRSGKLYNKFMTWFMLFSIVGSVVSQPISAFAQDSESVIVSNVVEPAEVQPSEMTEVHITEPESENYTELPEVPNTTELSESANANDSPESESKTEEELKKEAELKEALEKLKEALESQTDFKIVPKTFEQVNWNDPEMIKSALDNPDFPFWTMEQVIATGVRSDIETAYLTKTQLGFDRRLTELLSGSATLVEEPAEAVTKMEEIKSAIQKAQAVAVKVANAEVSSEDGVTFESTELTEEERNALEEAKRKLEEIPDFNNIAVEPAALTGGIHIGKAWSKVPVGWVAGVNEDYFEQFTIDGDLAFCVEPAVPYDRGAGQGTSSGNVLADSTLNKKMAAILTVGKGYRNKVTQLPWTDWLATQGAIYKVLGNSVSWESNYGLNGPAIQARQDQIMREADRLLEEITVENQRALLKTVDVGQTVRLPITTSLPERVYIKSASPNLTARISGGDLVVTINSYSPTARVVLGKGVITGGTLYKYNRGAAQDMITASYQDPDGMPVNFSINQPAPPKGRIKLVKTMEDGGSPAGTQFAIAVNDGTYGQPVRVTLDESGVWVSDEYPEGTVLEITETKAVEGYMTTVVPNQTILAGQTVTVRVTNKREPVKVGKVKLIKRNVNADGGAGESAQGVQFDVTITEPDKAPRVEKITLDGQGTWTSGDFPVGTTFVFVETKATDGYVLDPAPITATVEANQTKEVTKDNRQGVGKIKIIKTMENGGTAQGVKFSVRFETPAGAEIETVEATIQGDGTWVSKDYPVGTVAKITETETKEGYVLDTQERTVTVATGETKEVTVNNAQGKGKIKIIKTMEDGVSSKGVVFSVRFETAGGDEIETVTATIGDDGTWVSKEYPHGTVAKITETSTLTGYVIDNQTKTLTIAKDETKEVTVNNAKGLGKIKINKSLEGGGSANGVVFSIRFETPTGDEIETVTATIDNTNSWISKDYPHGTVAKVTETSTVKHYVIDSETKELTISMGETKEISVENKKGLGKIKIIKTMENGTPADAEGVKFSVRFETADGQEIETVEAVIGQDGTWVSKDYPSGTVAKVTETESKTGWLLDGETKTLNLSTGETKEVTVNNKQALGNIRLVKTADVNWNTGAENSPLQGSKWGLFQGNDKISEKVTGVDGVVRFDNLPFGSYVLREIETPEGYQTSQDINVEINENGKTYEVSAVNVAKRGKFRLTKLDNESNNPVAFAGTEFKVKNVQTGQYVTYNGSDVLTTDEQGNVNVDNVLYGTYELSEIKAPHGYTISQEKVTFSITGGEVVVQVNFKNDRVKGKVNVTKVGNSITDATSEETLYGALYRLNYNGTSNLAGATFDVKKNGQVVATITTDERGFATADGLELGIYELVETKAPVGYVLNSTPIPFEIKYEGQEVSLVSVDKTVSNEYQVIRLLLNKLEERQTGLDTSADDKHGVATVENVEATAGKVFVIRTKEGISANGAEVVPAGGILVLFDTKDGARLSQDVKLPLGTYIVEEVATSENLKLLPAYEFQVTNNEGSAINEINLAQVTVGSEAFVNELERPKFKTTATFEDGSKVNNPVKDKKVKIIDRVYYTNLFTDGREYKATAVPYYKTGEKAGQPVLDAEGNPYTGTATFVPVQKDGYVDVVVEIDASNLGGQRVVMFEDMHQDEILVGIHHDIEDEDQSVEFTNPNMKTRAGVEDNAKVIDTDSTTVKDIIDFTNYDDGKYVFEGILMDKNTQKPVTDIFRSEIIVVKDGQSDGQAVVNLFVENLTEDTDLVVFEKAYRIPDDSEDPQDPNRELIDEHEDYNDEDQTVRRRKPNVKTTMMTRDELKDTHATDKVELKDIVKLESVRNKREYEAELTIWSTKHEGLLKDKDGNVYRSRVKVMVDVEGKEQDELVDFEAIVPITVDLSDLEDTAIVGFEDLYRDIDGKLTLIAEHHDPNDDGQTVKVRKPKVGTQFADIDGKKNIHKLNDDAQVELRDTVLLENVINGETYQLRGKIWDKGSNGFVQQGGADLEKTIDVKVNVEGIDKGGIVKEFKAVVPFTVRYGDIKGSEIVAFEDLIYKGKVIGEHHDPNDEGQTVRVRKPKVGTQFADVDGKKDIYALSSDDEVELRDTVELVDVINGETYVLKGKIWHKDGNSFVQNDGKDVESSVEVTVNVEGIEKGGLVDKFTAVVPFKVRVKDLAGSEIVAFEELHYKGALIGEHKDPNDEGQTIRVRKPKVGTTADVNNKKEEYIGGVVTLTDTVKIEGIRVGEEHTLELVWMNKSTGQPFVVDGKLLTTTKTFTATDENMEVKVSVELDTSKLESTDIDLVAFETLYLGGSVDLGRVIGEHRDLTDEGQTIRLKVKPIIPETGGIAGSFVPLIIAMVVLVGAVVGLVVMKKRKDA